MGLLLQCPQCHYKGSATQKFCEKCGYKFGGGNQKIYWIDYYVGGKRRREQVGPSKREALDFLGKRKAEIRENKNKLWDRKEVCNKAFQAYAQEYLGSSRVKRYRSFNTERSRVRKLAGFFAEGPINSITPTRVEDFKAWRLSQNSYRGKKVNPGTVNRELATLSRMFERLIDDERLEKNPVKKVRKEKENKPRDRILSAAEYHRLLKEADAYVKPVLIVAYGTGMRKQEILKLKRDRVDLKEDFIRLRPEDTKTREGRNIPLDPAVRSALRMCLLKGSREHDYVFSSNGKPIGNIRKAFASACKKARIKDFLFHDFRHTWITNKRREGHDYFKIMAASGHRTMEVFKRYNTISEADLRTLVQPNGHQSGHHAEQKPLTTDAESNTNNCNLARITSVGD